MSRWSGGAQIVIGLCIALVGVRGVIEYDAAWLRVLFALVMAAGLARAERGRLQRNADRASTATTSSAGQAQTSAAPE